nr:glycogen synthase GlgA [uncultured Moellerella sp.]
MKILHCCSELFPLLKTGGLADVMGALPSAQQSIGLDVRLVMPGFPVLLENIKDLQLVTEIDTFAGHIRLLFGHYNDIGIYLIDAPHLYQRAGSPYHDSLLHPYSDNVFRFALLGWVAAELSIGLDPFWHAEVVHAHDWHGGMACAYIALNHYPAKSVFTVHNLAYQGTFHASHLHQLLLPDYCFGLNGLEYYGQISFLKAGLYYANHITTVSPTYAKEITSKDYGCGLEGLLKSRQAENRLSGILNGVDDAIWDPSTDTLIVQNFDVTSLEKKGANKQHLQEISQLPVDPSVPLFTVVSRLTAQKGLDLVLAVLPSIVSQGGQFILLGAGDEPLEEAFLTAQRQYPQNISIHIGYNEPLSHQMIAGADVIMLPSRFEPCGLTQLYGLKYGTLPLVRHTGGLADTVNDCALENLATHKATGFVFYDAQVDDLQHAVDRAMTLWSMPKNWQQVQSAAMKQDYFNWETAAYLYYECYQTL